jgi:hypothetical protein
MGLFTGRFAGWSPTFILLAIFFCLVARLFNTFPISFVANFTRTEKASERPLRRLQLHAFLSLFR